MAQRRRLGRKLFKSLLPILLVLTVAVGGSLIWIVYGITNPPRQPYLVTPQSFSNISGSALKVTDETWTNRDGTKARGWLLRGGEGAPAVVFLHRYGGDRSWLFNLGIKLNETTNFTILWPDLRGHGIDPPVKSTSFGNNEEGDLLAALDFLRTLKSPSQNKLIADRIGVYGVELGSYAALRAASQSPGVQVLALDSVPRSADEMVNAAVSADIGVEKPTFLALARLVTRVYFFGKYVNKSSCELAAPLKTQRILLLAGADDGYLRESTASLRPCFSNSANVESKTDLPLTGFKLASATGEQGEAYDRPVIDFFARNLR
jgi:pimeloyl-ACP methyl ester carboxylesterase